MTIEAKLSTCMIHRYDCHGCPDCGNLHRDDCRAAVMQDVATIGLPVEQMESEL